MCNADAVKAAARVRRQRVESSRSMDRRSRPKAELRLIENIAIQLPFVT
jgi:hypothetical protein